VTGVSRRLLGVDSGRKRIGLAITDPDRIIASPLETWHRRTLAEDAAYFAALVQRERVSVLVVGLPIRMDETEGDAAKEAREFGRWLGSVTGLHVVWFDERYTSANADSMMRDAGLNPKKRKERLDRVAAQLILEGYLEAGCPDVEPPSESATESAK